MLSMTIESTSVPISLRISRLGGSVSLHPQMDPIVGRADDLACLHRLLLDGHCRLLTLTGPGGVGKTRLAVQAAHDLQEDFSGAAHLIELASLRDPGAVAASITRSLGLPGISGRSPIDVLCEHLRERRLLLVLDNFEHLLAAAPVVSTLLDAAPELTVLATSRTPLGLPREHAYAVSPLAIPAEAALSDEHALLTCPSVALFVRRAEAARPDFRLRPDNASVIADVCCRLEGLPLALELAAARIRMLSPWELRDRLQRRLPILSAGPETLPERHRALRDVIAWSYDLLDPAARQLFRRCAVFAGGWTLDAAEAVSGVDGTVDVSVLDALTTLVDHGLVQRYSQTDGGSRFGMLETVREYALEQLQAAGEDQQARDRHLQWCHDLVERTSGHLRGEAPARWFDLLETEHDNVRSALAWADLAGDVHRIGLAMASALGRIFWPTRGYHPEGRSWLGRLLRHAPEANAARAAALDALGNLAQRQNDYPVAYEVLTEAIEIFRQLNDQPALGTALRRLGTIPHHLGDFDGARAILVESADILRNIGDNINLMIALHNLGDLASDRGDLTEAVTHYSEALAVGRRHRDTHGIAYALRGLGGVDRRAGRYSEAALRFQESLSLLRPLRDRRCIPLTLEGLACLAVGPDWAERAARLFGAAHAIQRQTGAPPAPTDMADYRRTEADARAVLGDERYEALAAEAAAQPLDDIVAYALAPSTAPAAQQQVQSAERRRAADARSGIDLTPREREVLALIAHGLSNREIGSRLTISVRTVERHIENLYNRLGCTGKAGRAIAAAYAVRHGIVSVT